jgi:hypothetical protein
MSFSTMLDKHANLERLVSELSELRHISGVISLFSDMGDLPSSTSSIVTTLASPFIQWLYLEARRIFPRKTPVVQLMAKHRLSMPSLLNMPHSTWHCAAALSWIDGREYFPGYGNGKAAQDFSVPIEVDAYPKIVMPNSRFYGQEIARRALA